MTPDIQHAGRPAETGGPGRDRLARSPLQTPPEDPPDILPGDPPGALRDGPPEDLRSALRGDLPGDPPAPRTATVALDGAGDRERLGRATGTGDPYLRERLINDMLGCLALANGAGMRAAGDAVRAALAALESLAPANAAEGMLAVQAVGCHAAAMECLRRAARDEGPPAARDWNLRHAERLMALYERQTAALDRRREARHETRRGERREEAREDRRGTRPPADSDDRPRRPTASAEPPATARPHLARAPVRAPCVPFRVSRDTCRKTGRETGRETGQERGDEPLKDRLLGSTGRIPRPGDFDPGPAP